MKIRPSIFLLFAIIMMMKGQAASEEMHLPLATGDWPPYISESVSDPGIFREILDEVFKLMKVKPIYEFYSWKRAEYQAEKGYNFAAFPYIKTPERSKRFDFSDPVVVSTGRFFYKKERFPNGIKYKTLEDLKPYYISGLRGYWYEANFEAAGLKVEYVSSDEIGFKKLDLGRVDLVPTDVFVGWEIIKKLFPDRLDRFATLETYLNQDAMCLMVSKKYPESSKILLSFNEKLAEFKSTKAYHQILLKYGIKE